MGDPVIEHGMTLAAGGVGGLIGLAYMARGIIRRIGRDMTEMTKDRVESDLYQQLSDQVKDNRQMIAEYQEQREQYLTKIRDLESKVVQCQQHAETIADLQRRLDARELQMKNLLMQWRQERKHFLSLLEQQRGPAKAD